MLNPPLVIFVVIKNLTKSIMASTTATCYSVFSSDHRHYLGNNQIQGRSTHSGGVHNHRSSSPSLYFSSGNQRLLQYSSMSSMNLRLQSKRNSNMAVKAIENLQPGGPLIPPIPQAWYIWLSVSMIPMLLAFFKDKWGPLLKIKQDVDAALNTIEAVAEAVEVVARKTDAILDEVEDKIPEGRLRNALCAIDKVAENVIKGADLTEDLIQKVEALEDKLEDLMERPDGIQGKMLQPESLGKE